VDRGAEAAAVNAMARGSQHKTMSAISHRMARSESVSVPNKLGDVADLCRFGLDLPALGAQSGPFSLKEYRVYQSPSSH
jgi:hypothetical protein